MKLLICKKCGQFFIRYPCPACGEREIQVPKQDEMDETLRKPSEIGKEQDDEEKLVRPSQFKKSSSIGEIGDGETNNERLVKPSQLKGGSAVNPNFGKNLMSSQKLQSQQVLLKRQKVKSQKLSPRHFQPIQKQVSKIQEKVEKEKIQNHLKSKGETDEEYKSRVRETLLEVMSLLEKLIE